MKAILENGTYKAVYESTTYYCWFAGSALVRYYTLSATPSVGDVVYENSSNGIIVSPNNYVASFDGTNLTITQESYTYTRRASEDITENKYKLISN